MLESSAPGKHWVGRAAVPLIMLLRSKAHACAPRNAVPAELNMLNDAKYAPVTGSGQTPILG